MAAKASNKNAKKLANDNCSESVVNDGTKNMFVAVRIRPLSEKEKSSGQNSCCNVIDSKIVTIEKNGIPGMYLKSQAGSLHEYQFDAAFDDKASQLDVYSKTTKPFLQDALGGINVTVFAYGATGAGKTHTLMGNTRCDDAASHGEAGIIPNAIADLFQLIQQRKNKNIIGDKWEVSMNYIEVYNEQVYDLLGSNCNKVLAVREDKDKGIVVVAGATETVVQNGEEVLGLLQQGNRNRSTEATSANSVSSRSHAILQMTIRNSQRTSRGGECVTESKLSLIDLAGSERASATNNRGARLQEGANINRSLLALANCINALSQNSSGNGCNGNVKYRDSKLTHLLKCSLEGNCKVIMIANVNPSHLTFEDSHNTLKYANRAKNIKLTATIESNQSLTKDSNWLERENRLRTENSELKARVLYLEKLIEQYQGQLVAAFGNNSSCSSGSISSGSNMGIMSPIATIIPGKQHRSSVPENVSIDINDSSNIVDLNNLVNEDGIEIIRAHSPTMVRQIKNEKINNQRRRSSAHVLSADEIQYEETKRRTRKNRASMCAEVINNLVVIPTINTAVEMHSHNQHNENTIQTNSQAEDEEITNHNNICNVEVSKSNANSHPATNTTALNIDRAFLKSQTPSKIPIKQVSAFPHQPTANGGNNNYNRKRLYTECGSGENDSTTNNINTSSTTLSFSVDEEAAEEDNHQLAPLSQNNNNYSPPVKKLAIVPNNNSTNNSPISFIPKKSPYKKPAAKVPSKQPPPPPIIKSSATTAAVLSATNSPNSAPNFNNDSIMMDDFCLSADTCSNYSQATNNQNDYKAENAYAISPLRIPTNGVQFAIGTTTESWTVLNGTSTSNDNNTTKTVAAVAKKRRGSFIPRVNANVMKAVVEQQQQNMAAETDTTVTSIVANDNVNGTDAATTRRSARIAATDGSVAFTTTGMTTRRKSVVQSQVQSMNDENSNTNVSGNNGNVAVKASSSLASKMIDLMHRVTNTNTVLAARKKINNNTGNNQGILHKNNKVDVENSNMVL